VLEEHGQEYNKIRDFGKVKMKEIYSNFFDSGVKYIKITVKPIELVISHELESLKSHVIGDEEQLSFNQIPVFKEKFVEFRSFKLIEELDYFYGDIGITNEFRQFHNLVQDKDAFNHYLIGLLGGSLSISGFIEEISKIKNGISAGIRIAIYFISRVEEIRLVTYSEAKTIADIAVNALQGI